MTFASLAWAVTFLNPAELAADIPGKRVARLLIISPL
jgi:hypothetical protein